MCWQLWQHLKKIWMRKMKEIDTEYLDALLDQIRCKNNGINSHIHKKGFLKTDGLMINNEHFSFEYLREKSLLIDALINTIKKDILMKSGKFRRLEN